VIVVVMALLPVLDLIVTTEMTLLDNARDDRVIVMALMALRSVTWRLHEMIT